MSGTLYLVATPIGNLGDFSPRAVETLNAVDFIAAEDTRVSVKLLNHFAIKKPLVSYHEHNHISAGQAILERLKAYREQHGLGCLPQLARLGGAGVTTEVLRDALTGAAKLPLQTWRAIGRALDKAEQQEGADE